MKTIAGKYRVLDVLGEGASGKVYLVEHTDLGVKYALKMLQSSLAEDDRFIERFKQEAGVLLRFSHPGSVQLRDFGKARGHYYFTMDLCDGTLLQQAMAERGRFPAEEALDYLQQILSVLQAAHEAGVVHRDIKPDNLMVVPETDGTARIKVMDFGIAKLLEGAKLDSSLTLEGASIGTPKYMSPEQASGEKDIDARADVYSCGILLYELLTGINPFYDESIVKTLLLQITKLPSPFSPALGIPPYIEQTVFKALRKDRRDRFQTAGQFREACLECLRRLKSGEQPASSGSRAVAPTPTRAPSAPGDGFKVMCLDDDPMVLNIMRHLLEREGYTVFTAQDPSELDRYIFAEGAKLLISDIQMPGLPGTTVCKLLKLSMKDLRIILFSNIEERSLEQAAMEVEADGWISKNWLPADWLKTVQQVIRRSTQTAAEEA